MLFVSGLRKNLFHPGIEKITDLLAGGSLARPHMILMP